ncbi:MAG: sulfatase-like hydrolase/transferase, partial [Victivallales bacterium]|nr:sulfatase-like hydrolase/transferase [Victivallales bacterium]
MTVNPNMDVADNVVWREGMTLETMRDFDAKKKNWVPLLRDDAVVEYPCDQTTLTQRYTNEAIEFIDANQDNPFFLYLAHMYVHVPLYAPERFLEQSRNGKYGAAVEHVDFCMAVLFDELERLGLDDNTLVIFTSDNGGAPQHGASNAPLRGQKGTTWEGGMRVPCVMRW